jgi:hypothetical protein
VCLLVPLGRAPEVTPGVQDATQVHDGVARDAVVADGFRYPACPLEIDAGAVEHAGEVEPPSDARQRCCHPRRVVQTRSQAKRLAPMVNRDLGAVSVRCLNALPMDAVGLGPRALLMRCTCAEPGDLVDEKRIFPSNSKRGCHSLSGPQVRESVSGGDRPSRPYEQLAEGLSRLVGSLGDVGGESRVETGCREAVDRVDSRRGLKEARDARHHAQGRDDGYPIIASHPDAPRS